MKCVPLFLIVVLICGKSFAQTSYFQQNVNYEIKVRLDDQHHELFAEENIKYTNNSLQTLNLIYFHLWPNGYKNDSTALAKQLLDQGNTEFYFSSKEQRGFIDQLDFKVNGIKVKWVSDSIHIDICKIFLNAPLQPGASIEISTPFHIKIPDSRFSRLGHEGQAYQISQWYPKPAVYDLEGWHAFPYLNQGEFYSEYGSFDVEITLPENYVLAATGDRMQAEKELAFLEQKNKETKNRTTYSHDMSFPLSAATMKTVHFHQNKVHDFAWFADKRYHVMKSAIELPDSAGTVTTWTFYTNARPSLWMNAINYVNKGIYAYSKWIGPYPYKEVSAVEGALSAGGGMEYPNITVVGPVGNALELETVIVHEIGHNWFYGLLGSNERTHPWMDEGVNTFYEIRYMQQEHSEKKNMVAMLSERADRLLGLNTLSHKELHNFTYLLNARRGMDQPLSLAAQEYTELNYGGGIYSKTGISLNYLKSYLGTAVFDSCMKSYFRTWEFKHPQPADFKKAFTKNTFKNTEWFFSDLVNSTKKLDYDIRSAIVSPSDSSYKITIQNTGDISGPFPLSGCNFNGSCHQIWFEGFKGIQTVSFPFSKYDSFQLDPNGEMPSLWRHNNAIRTNGILNKMPPIRLKFLAEVERTDRMQIFYVPVLGFNNYDKLLAGLAFYNSLLPSKKLEFVMVPMYAFGSQKIVGTANINYNIYSNESLFQHIQPGLSFMEYDYADTPLLRFRKLVPYIQLTLQKAALSHSTKNIKFRLIHIQQDQLVYIRGPQNYEPQISTNLNLFQELIFEIKNDFVLNPSQFTYSLQHGKEFLKTSIEETYKIIYRGKNRGFDLRFFAGAFLYNTYGNVPFRTSSWSGFQDYLYDDTFLGRSDRGGLLAQQMVLKEGGFKVPSYLGNSTSWLTALNLNTSLPGSLPIKAFIDCSLYPSQNNTIQFLYDAGLQVTVIPQILNVYFPIFISDQIQKVLDLNNITFAKTIRFDLNINHLNPFNYIRNIH